MPPSRANAKRKRHVQSGHTGGTLYTLHLQLPDGGKVSSSHASAKAAAEAAWKWGMEDNLFCLCSAEWEIRHPKYSWQNAHNLLDRDDRHSDEDFKRAWTAFFVKCMNSSTLNAFEADGEGKIACYAEGEASSQPFWRQEAQR